MCVGEYKILITAALFVMQLKKKKIYYLKVGSVIRNKKK